MSQIKIPVFGGLVTYADPEDIKQEYTPLTSNFDISEMGVLKRRDPSAHVGSLQDRGINSMFQWVNADMTAGSEWICYCNRRGLIFRMDSSLRTVKTGGYNRIVNLSGLNYLAELYGDLPSRVTFTSLGNSLCLNMGLDQDNILIHYVKHSYFNNQFTPPAGIYTDKYDMTSPDYSITLTATQSVGDLPANQYVYNIAPIYDGVNEYPLVELNEKAETITSGNNGNIKIDIQLKMKNQSRRLTNLKVYRSISQAGTKKAFRQIKNINLLAKATTQTGLKATGKMSRYAVYTESVLPTQADLISLFNSENSTSYSSAEANFGWMLFKDVSDLTHDDIETITYLGSSAKIGGFNIYNSSDSSVREDHGTQFQNGFNLFYSDSSDEYTRARVDNHILRNIRSFRDYGTRSDINDPQDSLGSTSGDWTQFSNANVVIGIAKWSYTDGRAIVDEKAYVIIPKCYMGENHIYYPDNTLPAIDNMVGRDMTIAYTDEDNVSQSFTETVLSNTRSVISLAPTGTPADFSSDLKNASRHYDGTTSITVDASSRNIMIEQSIDTEIVGDILHSYDTATDTATISLTDSGLIDGSIMPLSLETKLKSRWKYSELHGGRLFVANVLIDPDDVAEFHQDMILFSEAGQYGVIPIGNYIRIKDPQGGGITGLKSMGDSLCVLMENGIYRLKVPTIDPTSFGILESNEFIGCIAPYSVIKVEDSIYFCGDNNIFKVNGMFNVEPIGTAILDNYKAEADKNETIAIYDPKKECLLFRFGKTKHTLYEYNISRNEWNTIVLEAPISDFGLGISNHVFAIDNTRLTAVREDGNSTASEPSPSDDPSDLGVSIDDVNNGSSYWSDTINASNPFSSVVTNTLLVEYLGDLDYTIPASITGTVDTYVNYKTYRLFKQVDGSSPAVYKPIKNTYKTYGLQETLYYWDTQSGFPDETTTILKGTDFDGSNVNNLKNITIDRTSVEFTYETFYGGGEGTYESGTSSDGVSSVFGTINSIIEGLKLMTENEFTGGSSYASYNSTNETYRFNSTAFTSSNTKYTNNYFTNHNIGQYHVPIKIIGDNELFGTELTAHLGIGAGDSGLTDTEMGNLFSPMIVGKIFLPDWDQADSSLNSVQWNLTQYIEEHKYLYVAFPRPLFSNYNQGDFNSYGAHVRERMIILKANNNITKPTLMAVNNNQVSILIYLDVLGAQKFMDFTWQ